VAHRPRIGIVVDHNPGTMERFGGAEAHHFLNARYTQAIDAAGGQPWLIPIPAADIHVADWLAPLDGLLLTGCGRHIDPAAYGQQARHALDLMAPAKQAFETTLIGAAMAQRMPILGICSGMQALNVALGGTLVQRIADEIANPLAHMQTDSAIHTAHPVTVTPGTLLADLTGGGTLAVNSSHTQSVDALGDGLTVGARSPDGVIEAVEGAPGLPWRVAVQWHPEYLYLTHPSQARLFVRFVDACGERPTPDRAPSASRR